jgi:hypothetical protein
MEMVKMFTKLGVATWLVAIAGCGAADELANDSTPAYDDEVSTTSEALMAYDGLSLSNGLQGTNGLTANGFSAGLANNGLQVRLVNFKVGGVLACKCNLVCEGGALVYHPLCCTSPSYVPPDACK